MGESVQCAAVHVQLPVCTGAVHLLREGGDVGEGNVRVLGPVAGQQPGPDLSWLRRAAGGQASVNADRAGQSLTGAGKRENRQAAETEANRRHPPVHA